MVVSVGVPSRNVGDRRLKGSNLEVGEEEVSDSYKYEQDQPIVEV